MGLLLILACVVYSKGLSAGLDVIEKIGTAVIEVFKVIAALAIQFPGELGITDWLWTRGIYGIVAVAAVLLTGYAFTRKEKNKLLGIIGSVVSLISTILTFSKSK